MYRADCVRPPLPLILSGGTREEPHPAERGQGWRFASPGPQRAHRPAAPPGRIPRGYLVLPPEAGVGGSAAEMEDLFF